MSTTEGGTLRMPGDHRREAHGGRNVAQRLDQLDGTLVRLVELLDGQAAAQNAWHDHITARIEAIEAVVGRIDAATQGQALVLGQAVPPLVDALAFGNEAERVGLRRAWRARRRARRA